MNILAFYPIMTILGGGLGLYFVIERRYGVKFRKTEIFNFAVIAGSFLLVVPWVFIGIQPSGQIEIVFIKKTIFFDVTFDTFAYIYYAALLMLALYASYHVIEIAVQEFEKYNMDKIREFFSFEVIVFIIFIAELFLLEYMLPLRGFDSLFLYFPQADVLYYTNRIPEVNYFSFMPIVKSPFNVMLYTFTLYITEGPNYEVFPILFLIGSSLIVYDFIKEQWTDEKLAQLGSLVFLVMPVIYWTFSYWAFYQDLYVSYFVGGSFYFIWKGIVKNGNHRMSLLITSIMSMALALLSKINAWPMFAILVIAIPTNKRGKVVQLIILAGLTSFLVMRAITTIFIGVGVVILIFASYIFYLIAKKPVTDTKMSISSLLIFISTSVVLGGFWINDRINKSAIFQQELNRLYFEIFDTIKWEFEGVDTFTFDLTLERMHAVNFWSAALFLFIGVAFSVPWIVPKLLALIHGQKNSFITIWLVSYFMIWMTYYFQGSIRYLSPIFIPMAIIITYGFKEVLMYFKLTTKSIFPKIALIFFGVANFYYLIPIEVIISPKDDLQKSIGTAYNQSAFSYYSQPLLALLQASIYIFVWILIMYISSGRNEHISRLFKKAGDYFKGQGKLLKNLFSSKRIYRLRTTVATLFLLLIITVPVATQGFVWLTNNGNRESFQGTIEYEYHQYFREVITIIEDESNSSSGIISVRMPGLQFFTQRPVLDFYYQGYMLGDLFYEEENISILVSALKDPLLYLKDYLPEDFNISIPYRFSFDLIITPNTENIYFKEYMANVYLKSTLFQSLYHTDYFDLIFSNPRYKVFKVL